MKKMIYEFEASIPLNDLIEAQEIVLSEQKKVLPPHIVMYQENTVKYLKLLRSIMDNNVVIDQSIMN
ncbi:MAG: hypothetical protein LBV71_08365, partial [Prevotella sp.]|nr:hypothetical protein [Prevotella sp.]